MNKEFFEAVNLLEKEKGISSEYLYEKITAAIISATRNTYGNRDIVVCDINPEEQTMRVYVRKNVVEEIEDEYADLTVMVLRANLIKKDVLPFIEDLYRDDKLKHLALILNGVELQYKKYGYGKSGYGYGYGYSSADE